MYYTIHVSMNVLNSVLNNIFYDRTWSLVSSVYYSLGKSNLNWPVLTN